MQICLKKREAYKKIEIIEQNKLNIKTSNNLINVWFFVKAIQTPKYWL